MCPWRLILPPSAGETAGGALHQARREAAEAGLPPPMPLIPSKRRSTFQLALLLLGLVAGSACSRQEEFDTLFREKLAKRALDGFHPLGKIKSAGPIEIGQGDSFRGTISPIPAAEPTCRLPLEEPAVPAHTEGDAESREAPDAAVEDSSSPADAPPPP